MNFTKDFLLIKKLEREVNCLDKSLEISKDNQSIIYQEIKEQYIKMATLLNQKRDELVSKILLSKTM